MKKKLISAILSLTLLVSTYTSITGIYSASAKETNMMFGIDVSEHNGDIDWKTTSKYIDFAILRVGYGGNYTSQDDKKFIRNAEACKKYKIPFGVYLYSYAKNTAQAKSEAEHTLRLIKKYKLDFPVFYDLEENSQAKLGSTALSSMAKTYCNEISKAGYKVGVYANTYWFTNILTNPTFNNPSWYKWVAQYNTHCTYTGPYQMWQFSSKGKIDGISGNVDVNLWCGGKIPSSNNTGNDLPIKVLDINKTKINISLGNNIPKTASIKAATNSKKGIKYISSNTKVATVNSKGKVTAKNRGTCYIKVYLKENPKIYKKCKITVVQKVKSLSISKSKIIFNSQKENALLTAKVLPTNTNNKNLIWSCNNKNVACLSSDGNIIPKNKGTCKITAKTTDGSNLSVSCYVTVKEIIPEKIINVKQKLRINLGGTEKISPKIYPQNATNKDITYSSSNENVATVDNKGNITGKSIGECQIVMKAKGNNSIQTKTKIVVTKLVTDIAPSTNSVCIVEEEKYLLKTFVLPSDATNQTLKYSSNNNSIAIVDPKGEIIGKKEGNCIVTVSTTDGSKKEVKVNVKVLKKLQK